MNDNADVVLDPANYVFGTTAIESLLLDSIMDFQSTTAWIGAIQETVNSYRRMIDATVEQLSDAELHVKPAANLNSVAVILRHLGGNLRSRWTDFLTTDGEKPDRDRDREFLDWDGDRDSLIDYFDQGWHALTDAIGQLDH